MTFERLHLPSSFQLLMRCYAQVTQTPCLSRFSEFRSFYLVSFLRLWQHFIFIDCPIVALKISKLMLQARSFAHRLILIIEKSILKKVLSCVLKSKKMTCFLFIAAFLRPLFLIELAKGKMVNLI